MHRYNTTAVILGFIFILLALMAFVEIQIRDDVRDIHPNPCAMPTAFPDPEAWRRYC